MPFQKIISDPVACIASGDVRRPSIPEMARKPGRSQIKRYMLMSAPAALISYGLFLMMGSLIAAEFVPAEASEPRVITKITPEKLTPEELAVRVKVEPIETLSAPPPPPKVSIKKVNVPLDAVLFTGEAPKKVEFNKRDLGLDVRPVAISNREATPIRPPIVSYPRRAIDLGIEGTCAVHLDVDVRGHPYNVKADCTDRIFEKEAVRAVSRVEFSPMIVKGTARERRNVVYPLEFTFSNP